MLRHKYIVKISRFAAITLAIFAMAAAQPVRVMAAGPMDKAFSYTNYGEELGTHVNDNGMVDYKGLKAQSHKLDEFAATLAKLDRKDYEKWTDNEKIAFWINAYNALTLRAIIDHYPIQSSFFRSLRFPKNSIRQIPGVWDELKFTVMNEPITLDGIEHDTLRAKFDEPRIHMALVCAAMGCPPLRNKPYIGEKLDAQLNNQSNRFLGNPKQFRIDRDKRTVYLSSIFKWFGNDFVKKFGTDRQFAGYSDSERAVLNFISKFVKPGDRTYLERGGYSIDYLDYDWSLNEQQR